MKVVLPAQMASLPGSGIMVCVGPPFHCSGPSVGAVAPLMPPI
jgi:hypothetical protein